MLLVAHYDEEDYHFRIQFGLVSGKFSPQHFLFGFRH